MNGDHKLTTADVHQMAGRGTRSQGIPEATIVMIAAKLKVSVKAVLSSNDDDGAVNTVPGNVRRLLRPMALHSPRKERRQAQKNC